MNCNRPFQLIPCSLRDREMSPPPAPLTFLCLDGSGGEGYEMKWPNMDILSWLEMTIKWGKGGGNTAYSQTVHVRCLCWFWFNFFAKNINLHHHYLMCGKTATRPLGHTHCHWLIHVNINLVKLLHLSHFSLPCTLFEGCGAVYIMNSKIYYIQEKIRGR